MTDVLPVKSGIQTDFEVTESVDLVSDPHLSIAESARALRISPSTLRRYVKDYEEHIDVVRSGRTLKVAVSSIPALAQIRDLRARKYKQKDIERSLSSVPDPVDTADIPTAAAIREAVDAALVDIRAELASIKAASRDSEVVVRQSLANILFLIDKFGKELQFHASEERIASNERDLRLEDHGAEPTPAKITRRKNNGLISSASAVYRRLSTALLFSRRQKDGT